VSAPLVNFKESNTNQNVKDCTVKRSGDNHQKGGDGFFANPRVYGRCQHDAKGKGDEPTKATNTHALIKLALFGMVF
jgi:hypothetical protein